MNTIKLYDLFVIGGGINGVGITADAAGRDLKVGLCEQDDFASHTSSASSKLIHGGLRYLEYYEFRLVREALAERDVLLSIAPHIVQPVQLVIPHNQLQRAAWLIRLGLFLYDTLGKRFGKSSRLPKSRGVKLDTVNIFGKPLLSSFKKGFVYSDCIVDDARLVVLNAKAAEQRGAVIQLHTKFLSAQRQAGLWQIRLQNKLTGEETSITSKALVNAAGPWVDNIIHDRLQLSSKYGIELVKGSHIVVPRWYVGEHAYLLQNIDKRVIFVIPYHDQFTMIGTTDLPYHDDPADVKISSAEEIYLCEAVNRYFKQTIQVKDIVNSWSGVRPLQAEADKDLAAITRDYTLVVEDEAGQAPLLSIFGGKITTYRKLAEHALEKLKPYFSDLRPAWTAHHPLPGGDIARANLAEFILDLQHTYPWLPVALAIRYAHSYGSLCQNFLSGKSQLSDLGKNLGAGLYAAEINYLIQHEWASSVEDILWRRSKLGLFFSPSQVKKLQQFLTLQYASHAT